MIYLDYAANTPVDPLVLEAFWKTECGHLGNPTSNHVAGMEATEKLLGI